MARSMAAIGLLSRVTRMGFPNLYQTSRVNRNANVAWRNA